MKTIGMIAIVMAMLVAFGGVVASPGMASLPVSGDRMLNLGITAIAIAGDPVEAVLIIRVEDAVVSTEDVVVSTGGGLKFSVGALDAVSTADGYYLGKVYSRVGRTVYYTADFVAYVTEDVPDMVSLL